MEIRNILNRKYFQSVALYLGFSSSIAQVLLIRELLTIFRGNEFIIGMIFTGWFLGIFFGAKYNSEAPRSVLERRVSLSLLLLPVVLLIMLYVIHFIPLVFPRTPGTFFSLTTEFMLSLLFTIPVSFFVGYFFPPIVTILSETYKEKSGGAIYLIESFGAFAGGILFSYLLVDTLNPIGIVAILLFLALLLFSVRFPKKWFYLFLLLPLLLFHYAEEGEKAVFKYIWNRTQSSTLIAYERTRYQTISLGFNESQISVYGDGVVYYTIPDRYESRSVFHLIQSLRHNGNDEILIFGVGPGSIPYNLVRTDLRQLYYFEIDPQLWHTIVPYHQRFYPQGPEDRKLDVITQDLRYYLSTADKKFDMIVCFPPVPHNAMINRFYTREFYELCRSRLKPDGVFLTSLSGFSSYIDAEQKNFIASIYKGFIDVFPSHLRSSGETMYLIGAKKPGRLPATSGRLIADYGKKIRQLSEYPLERTIMQNFNPMELKGFFEPTHIQQFDDVIGPLLPSVAENRDKMPHAYWNYILHSAFQEQSLLYHLLKHYELFVIALLLITSMVLFNLKRRYGTEQFLGGLIIYAVGMVNMSVVLLMIMLYQNFYGVVYYRISLINALFMLGLTAGSFLANRYSLRSLRGVLLAMIVSLACVFVFIATREESLFWIILFSFSLFCGTAFPSLYMVLSRGSFHATASNLDAMEFFGSIVGSVLTTILLPIMGIHGALLFNVAALLCTFFVAVALHSGFWKGGGKSFL